MSPLKACDMCGTSSNETAIFSTTYAKGDMNICLECLTEGVLEVTNSMKKRPEIKFQDFPLEEFDVAVPEHVFGFNCEGCKEVLFSDSFPVVCGCGHLNNETVIHKQDVWNRK